MFQNLLEIEKLFIPIYMPGHWTLAVIRVKDKRFEYYDSLGGQKSQVLEVTSVYTLILCQVCRSFWVMAMCNIAKEEVDLAEWKTDFPDAPRQTNTHDCGAFVCQYSVRLSEEEPTLHGLHQNDITRLRKEMANTLKVHLGVPTKIQEEVAQQDQQSEDKKPADTS